MSKNNRVIWGDVNRYLLEKVSPYLIIIFGSAITGNMLPESVTLITGNCLFLAVLSPCFFYDDSHNTLVTAASAGHHRHLQPDMRASAAAAETILILPTRSLVKIG